jgi:hypothetical protein
MPAVTNSQFLPYQVSTDRRCDAPEVWQAFLSAFEARYRPMVNLANRLTNVPMAMVERRTPWDIATMGSPGGTISYDTVVLDTDGMVNLDADPTAITPQRRGWYLAHGFLRVRQPDLVVSGIGDLGLSFSGGFAGNFSAHNTEAGYMLTDIRIIPLFASDSIDVQSTYGFYWNPEESGAGFPDPLTMNKTGDNTTTYSFAQMAAIWIADV